jgi:superfamily II DNA or RNA helicase
MTLIPVKMPDLYDYQATDVENIEAAWTRVNAVLYQLSTGGGKSVVMAKLVADYKDENIIIFAHKRKLLKQLMSRFAKMGLDVGLMQGQNNVNLDAKILIVSIRTAGKDRRLETLLKRKWNRVYVDEARHTRTGTYDKVLDTLKESNPTIKMFGVDATPYRKDGKRLDKHWQELVVSVKSTADLISEGRLSNFKTIVTPIGRIEEEVDEVANDYQQTQLSTYMRQPKFLKYVVDQYKEHGQEKQAIAFAVDKVHATDVVNAFRTNGYSAIKPFVRNGKTINVHQVCQINSDMSEEEIDIVYEAYEAGLIQIIVNIEMATEGVDLPDTGCIILARPTKSLTLYLQMLGRGTRIASDGEDLIIIDCSGNFDTFGSLSSPRQWSLNPDIDPNGLREKNRIVGKKADGTFVEIDEDFIGEAVEMTPEEYVKHLASGVEMAEQTNVSIDDKISALFDALIALFTKLMKDKFANFDIVQDRDERRNTLKLVFLEKGGKEKWDKNIADDNLYKNRYMARVTIDLKATFLMAGIPTDISLDSVEAKISYMKLSILLGDLNKMLLETPKLNAKTIELITQMDDLRKSKININEIKEQAKEFQAQQAEKQLRDYAAWKGTFILPSQLLYDTYFKKSDSDWGWNMYITEVHILTGSINNHHNTIKLTINKQQRGYCREEICER